MKKPLHLTGLLVCASVCAFATPHMAKSAIADRSLFKANEVAWIQKAGMAAINGTVSDNTGTKLIGVTVAVKGTTNGTQTNVQGQFTLSVKPGDVLVISYIGYKTQEVTV